MTGPTKVSPRTAVLLMDHVRCSMPTTDFRRLTIAQVLELYREQKLQHLLAQEEGAA